MVSVVIPMYNVERWVERSLRSILEQSYQHFEIICLDDCSTDDTVKLVETLCRYDKRIRLKQMAFHLGNPGILRNHGINLASGKYITFVDADDMVEPDFLKKMLSCAEKYHSDIVWGYCVFKRYGKDVILAGKFFSPGSLSGEQISNLLIDICYHGSVWGKLFLKAFLVEHDISFDPELRLGEDQNFCFKTFTATKRIAVCDAVYYYIRHYDSMSNYYDREYFMRLVDTFYKNTTLLKASKIGRAPFIIMLDRMLEERYNALGKLDDPEIIKEYLDRLMGIYYSAYN